MAQDGGAYLTRLRRLIENLEEQATRASSVEDYLKAGLDSLVSIWPVLKTYQLEPVSVKEPVQSVQSSRHALQHDTTNAELEQWVVVVAAGNVPPLAVVKFRVPGDELLWQVVQLWAWSVANAWHTRRKSIDSVASISERLHLFESLSHVVQRIWAELVSTDILNAACQNIVETIGGIDRVGIVLNDNAPESGIVVAAYPPDTVGQRLQLAGYWIYDQLKSTSAPIVIDDVDAAREELGVNHALLKRFGIQSMMIVPLTIQGELIGSIGFDALQHKRTFTIAEVEVLSTLAGQIAISLQNAQLFEKLRARSASQQFVNQVLDSLPLRSDLQTLLHTTGVVIGKLMGATQFSIHLTPEVPQKIEMEQAAE